MLAPSLPIIFAVISVAVVYWHRIVLMMRSVRLNSLDDRHVYYTMRNAVDGLGFEDATWYPCFVPDCVFVTLFVGDDNNLVKVKIEWELEMGVETSIALVWLECCVYIVNAWTEAVIILEHVNDEHCLFSLDIFSLLQAELLVEQINLILCEETIYDVIGNVVVLRDWNWLVYTAFGLSKTRMYKFHNSVDELETVASSRCCLNVCCCLRKIFEIFGGRKLKKYGCWRCLFNIIVAEAVCGC